MKKYEDYKLPCVAQGGFDEGFAGIRTQFDYGIRQRRGRLPLPTATFSIVLKTAKDLEQWGLFWADINMGTEVFTTDARFGPYGKLGKKVRFIQGYQMQQLSKDIYRVTSTWEMTDPLHDAVNSCTLVPSDLLNPQSKLYPNKCPKP